MFEMSCTFVYNNLAVVTEKSITLVIYNRKGFRLVALTLIILLCTADIHLSETVTLPLLCHPV